MKSEALRLVFHASCGLDSANFMWGDIGASDMSVNAFLTGRLRQHGTSHVEFVWIM